MFKGWEAGTSRVERIRVERMVMEEADGKRKRPGVDFLAEDSRDRIHIAPPGIDRLVVFSRSGGGDGVPSQQKAVRRARVGRMAHTT